MLTNITKIAVSNEINIIISEIMNEIAKHQLLYLNEEQFQFDLAKRIEKIIAPNSNIRVIIESMSRINNTNNMEKTDIVIIDDQGNYVPIELKYKKYSLITEVNGRNEVLWFDGAANIGTFDYFYDIWRLECLKNHGRSTPNNIINHHYNNFICGFAIMITNDEKGYTSTSIKNIAYNMLQQMNNGKINQIIWKFGPNCSNSKPNWVSNSTIYSYGFSPFNNGKGYSCNKNYCSLNGCKLISNKERKKLKNQNDYRRMLNLAKTDTSKFYSFITEIN